VKKSHFHPTLTLPLEGRNFFSYFNMFPLSPGGRGLPCGVRFITPQGKGEGKIPNFSRLQGFLRRTGGEKQKADDSERTGGFHPSPDLLPSAGIIHRFEGRPAFGGISQPSSSPSKSNYFYALADKCQGKSIAQKTQP